MRMPRCSERNKFASKLIESGQRVTSNHIKRSLALNPKTITQLWAIKLLANEIEISHQKCLLLGTHSVSISFIT